MSKDIVIVGIDAESLEKINKKWPINRTVYAEAINILEESGAKVIMSDLKSNDFPSITGYPAIPISPRPKILVPLLMRVKKWSQNQI